MRGRGKPAADAAQSIVMCSDVPCACMYVFLLFLSVTTFFLGTIKWKKRFIAVVDLPGGVLQFVFLHYLFSSSKYCLTTSGFSDSTRLRSSLSAFQCVC